MAVSSARFRAFALFPSLVVLSPRMVDAFVGESGKFHPETGRKVVMSL